MFEDIRKNKIKTGFIISGFILIITFILYYLCMAFDLDASFAILIALSFSIISCWASYYNSDKIILAVSHAKPATEEENKKIMNILDGLMISSGLSSFILLSLLSLIIISIFSSKPNINL